MIDTPVHDLSDGEMYKKIHKFIASENTISLYSLVRVRKNDVLLFKGTRNRVVSVVEEKNCHPDYERSFLGYLNYQLKLVTV